MYDILYLERVAVDEDLCHIRVQRVDVLNLLRCDVLTLLM